MERWRVIETFGVTPAFAMGLDEALMRSVGTPPTLRLYTWEPDAISLGYFQDAAAVPAAAPGFDPQRYEAQRVVRRVTGGGAIHHHAAELTFSMAIDADHDAYRGSIPASYERMHEAIIRAVTALGVRGARMRREEACVSDLGGTGMCFHESTTQDICWEPDGGGGLAKGVGTAQRRAKESGVPRILHHGSIKLDGSAIEPGVATVKGATGATIAPEDAARAVQAAVAATFGIALEPAEPSAHERESALGLGERYESPAFVHRTVRRRSST